ncbi:hypothetical protein MMC25_003089 [Agyrium rufum]|nr:hypothetical protein [Agyrium rufum]
MYSRSLSLIYLAISLAFSILRVVRADADFLSVRVGMLTDKSGKGGDKKEKYFHESIFHPHYDGRFTDHTLGYDERQGHLVALVQSYLSTMADLGAQTWLMHGTLMGWWWNRKILPWDSDIDVQMSVETLSYVAKYYNMSVFHFKKQGEPNGRDYMIEINPDFATEGPNDHLNMIDARWIDMSVGLFIDITSVRPNVTARNEGVQGALMCKDKHHYLEEELFPLRDSFFEGIPVKVPYEYAQLLEQEYGKASLTRTEFQRHQFNQTLLRWEPIKGIRRPKGFRPVAATGKDKEQLRKPGSGPRVIPVGGKMFNQPH